MEHTQQKRKKRKWMKLFLINVQYNGFGYDDGNYGGYLYECRKSSDLI